MPYNSQDTIGNLSAKVKKAYSKPNIEVQEEDNRGNRYSLPYGLCKGVGIDTTGMTPREAWAAYTGKTGISKEQAEKEHWGKTANEKQPAEKNSPAQEAVTSEKNTQLKENKNVERAYSSTRKGVSEDWAARAQEMRSFSSYQQGSATSSYNASVAQFDKNVNELIQRYGNNATLTDKDWEEVYSIADRYAPNLEKYTDETNRNEASYPSWFISGPARYNVKKNEALMSRSRALYENNADRIDPDNNVYLKKIKSILTNASIKSDDSNAVEKLQAKYDALKSEVERGKALNAYFRKHGTLKGAEGISDATAQKFAEDHEREPYFHRQPYAAYRLQNANQELHRIQGRIDDLKKKQEEARAAEENPQSAKEQAAKKYPKVDGVEVEENNSIDRIQLRFADIPPAETREMLKRNGFRWSPSQKAWQRQLTANGKYATRSLLEKLGGTNG